MIERLTEKSKENFLKKKNAPKEDQILSDESISSLTEKGTLPITDKRINSFLIENENPNIVVFACEG